MAGIQSAGPTLALIAHGQLTRHETDVPTYHAGALPGAIGMTKENQEISKKKRLVFYFVMFAIPLTATAAIYLGYTVYRTVDLYDYVKSKQRGWEGDVHRADPELGFSSKPNSKGAHVFPIGPNIPMRYDEGGFRVPVDDDSDSLSSSLLLLALGCSFTYGDATYAEDTYPYLVGKYLNGTMKNAGVGSYGLSQMLILAKRLVPIHKPDYLLVQYSPWLVNRATRQFAGSYFGRLPNPYFYEENGFVLHPPLFLTKITDLSMDRYRYSPINTSDRLSFYWHVGLPLFIHDDFNMSLVFAKRMLGRIPEPTTARTDLTKYVYAEISKGAKEEGTKLVIVVLGNNSNAVPFAPDWFPADAMIVNAHGALIERMPMVNIETYKKLYAHWRGSPPRIVDNHPNEAAHKIIAEAIVSKIREAR